MISEEQFKQLATKEDLKNLRQVIKDEDLSKLATKVEDLQTELRDFKGNAFEFFASKQDLKNLKNALEDKMQVKFDQVLVGQDKLIKFLDDMRTESAADKLAHERYDEKLESHDIRIKSLEVKCCAE